MRGRWFVARWFAVVVLGVLGVLAVVPLAPVRAASNVVNTLMDASNGSCATTCTLRDAIALANDGETITFSVSGTITLDQTLSTITIGHAITIQGPTTTTGITIDGGCTDCQIGGAHTTGTKIFFVNVAGATVTMSRLTLTHGNGGSFGGAIENFNSGTLAVTDSLFTENFAGEGGAIISGEQGGALTVTNSTFVDNSVATGGTVEIRGAAMTMTNSTVTNSTVGIAEINGSATLTNVISANNSVDLRTIGGTFTGNNNLIDDNSFSTLTGSNNINAPALLGPLGTYGSTNGTQTLPLLPGSPAIAAGTTTGTGIPTTDQRGIARTGHNDIGAFQSQGFSFSSPTGTSQSTLINTQFATPLGITVTATAPVEPVDGGHITFTVTPAGGASATLATSPATITSGVASVTATANATAGGPYTVTPSANGVTGTATYTLTNLAATTTTAANATTPFSASAQTVTLTATVTSTAGTVTTGTVTFTVSQGATTIGSATTSGIVVNGVAGVSYTIPGGTARGVYTITAVYNAAGQFATSQDTTHTLTINGPLSLVVTNTNETAAGDAICAVGNCSLRQAVNASNASDPGTGNHHSITFANGLTGTLTLANGTLSLSRDVTIDGTGATITVDGGCTVVSGQCASGGVTVFTVNGGTVTINMLTIQHGNTAGGGGGIVNFGTLTVSNSVLSGNTAADSGGAIFSQSGALTVMSTTLTGNRAAFGGGIFEKFGTLTVTGSTLTGNSASGTSGNGGGIYILGGTVNVTTSTLANNSAAFAGGIFNFGTLTVTGSTLTGNQASGGSGIYNRDGGMATVTNSTFSGNMSTGSGSAGGGIANDGTATVTNSIFFGNSASSGGGGVHNGGTLGLVNSIIASNSGGNCSGTITDGGHNLQFGDTSCGGAIPNQNPLLGTLGTYGGPTQTIPLLPGSPAIDAGVSGAGIPTTDQRGIARVGAVDIGAFESRGFSFSSPTGTSQSAHINTAFVTPLGITVTANAAVEPVDGGQVTFTVTPVGGASASLATNPATISGGSARVTATANGTAGGPYTVTPSANGVTGTASYALTNTLVASTTTAQNATATFLSASQSVTLNATVTATTGTVNEGTVSFTVLQGATVVGSATSSPVTDGAAVVQYLLPPDTAVGTYTIQAIYNDAVGNFATSQDATHTLMIAPVTLILSPPSLPSGTVAIAYSQTLTATGGSGTGYTFAVTTGTLPAGLHLIGGALSGTPTAAGASIFTVTATDSAGNSGTQQYTLTIGPAPLVSIAVTPASATLKVGQAQQYVATGTYADSTTADLTSQVTWSSDAATVAAVNTSGNVTGLSSGTAHITAAQGNVSGQTSVTVTQPTPIGIQPGAAPAGRPSGTSAPSGSPIAAPTPKPLPTGR